MREAASLRQQRRMKQAVQFIHKDSADLLPLDGLKKLGSSKDTVSPRRRARLGLPVRGHLPAAPFPRATPLAAFTESPPGSDPAPLAFPRGSVRALPARARPGSVLPSGLVWKSPLPGLLARRSPFPP